MLSVRCEKLDPAPAGDGGGEYDSHGRIYWHMRERLVPPTDRALSALITELAERGMFDDTLLVVMGEFGRTPRLNPQAGRDHWPFAQSILLAGAGISGGTTYGATDRLAAYPSERPVTPLDLGQTILHLLGVPADVELRDRLGRPLPASRGEVLYDLIA
jgi:arylsulfatase A-like enzyme